MAAYTLDGLPDAISCAPAVTCAKYPHHLGHGGQRATHWALLCQIQRKLARADMSTTWRLAAAPNAALVVLHKWQQLIKPGSWYLGTASCSCKLVVQCFCSTPPQQMQPQGDDDRDPPCCTAQSFLHRLGSHVAEHRVAVANLQRLERGDAWFAEELCCRDLGLVVGHHVLLQILLHILHPGCTATIHRHLKAAGLAPCFVGVKNHVKHCIY